jgi:hypothetical protein
MPRETTFHEIKIVNTEQMYSVESRIAMKVKRLADATRKNVRVAYGDDGLNPQFSHIWIGDSGFAVPSLDPAAMMIALEFILLGMGLLNLLSEDKIDEHIAGEG